MTLGRRVMKVETFTDERGGPVYYVVYLQPSGFVVVSGDDLVEPIIGFADDGTYEASFENPLGALVTNDLNGRMAGVRNTFSLQLDGEIPRFSGDRLAPARAGAGGGPQSKWRYFIGLGEASEGGFGLMGLTFVSDIRVIPLVQSEWGQQDACGSYCYNYYSPRHRPCGCVATVMAQVMRYHEYPAMGIGVHEFTIQLDGSEQTAHTRGGDGSGGPYNWSDMVLRPQSSCSTLTESQRQAIGAICYDAGVSVKMVYSSAGSGALMSDARDALVSVFQYSNAVWGHRSSRNIGPGLNRMVNPNLDAKAPVILALSDGSDPNGGHAIICDGYGYRSSTLYHHLNMGWNGINDAWYNLPDVNSPQEKYTSVSGCLYNILTSGTGEIISGRVLDPNGIPIVNARVYAESSGQAAHMVLTDDKGIYALARLESDTTYTIRPQADGYEFSSQLAQTRSSRNDSATSGNRWGVDFYAEAVLNPPSSRFIFVDANAPGDPSPDDPAIFDPCEDGSAEHPFDAIQKAIDMAVAGDTVVVLRGTYTGQGNRDLDFKGKAITVRSEDPNDPNLVIIDCNGTADTPHRGFEFHNYETPLSVLDGLTITGGYNERGGGIYCGDYARPTVTNCAFSRNSASLGGGVYNESSSPTLTNCTFSANSADGGGGMYNNGDEPGCDPVLNHCTFYGNAAVYNGGGLYNWGQTSPTLTNCVFIQNSVSSGGGGAIRNNESGSPALTNCMFISNSAETFGGGIRNSNGGSTILTNCTFTANSAQNGSALACTADDGGSQSPCSLQVVNCILWDGGDQIRNDDSSIVAISYSNVQGGLDRYPWLGEGNIDADPHFADPNRGDYHLKSQAGRWDPNSQSWLQDDLTSPCIDAGNPGSDWTAELWPHGARINMGAYGGTPQASMSLSSAGNAADLNVDGSVDCADALLLMNEWLRRERFLSEDLDRNGIVNFSDFSIFAGGWFSQE